MESTLTNRYVFAAFASAGALVVTTTETTWAQSPESGFRISAGYKSLTLEQQSVSHDTHPDDSFLPNSELPGSAGTTEVGGRLNFFAAGVGYQVRLSESFSLTLDLGGLVGGERDEQQNTNDTRPAANGSFVYSEARWGLFATVGVQYHIKRFYVGAEAQLGAVFVDSGWDRYDKDENQHSEFELVPSAGPTIGYSITKDLAIEGTIQFGRSVDFGIQAKWKF